MRSVREANGKKAEFRIQESGVQESGVQESGVQESGVRSQESGVRSQEFRSSGVTGVPGVTGAKIPLRR